MIAKKSSTDESPDGPVLYPCANAHALSFEFGPPGRRKRFDVDPRDFGTPVHDVGEDNGEIVWCIPNLAPTDPPRRGGFLNSWSLGDPFLKG